jgi:GTPase SAR1 family protein
LCPQNAILNQALQDDHTQDAAINKLLLLGAGESGKSTLFKQMITIYGKGFPESERKTFVNIIYNNIITSMKTLVQQINVMKLEMDGAHILNSTCLSLLNFILHLLIHPPLQLLFADAIQKSCVVIENAPLSSDTTISKDLSAHVKLLWSSDPIQRAYERRASFQLADSASYFFDRLDVISNPLYIPSEQDVLRSRTRTTGIVENDFVISDNHFKMYDVGGQRNERKKWIHCFENVTAVLFVAAISEYDQVLFEDEETNRVVEALALFDDICNSKWFRNTSMILFLNKRDLFEEKLTKVPLQSIFYDYDGDNSFLSASNWIKEQFQARNMNASKSVYSHVTCATDTTNVSMVFNAVKDIIIRKSLNEAGLV